MTGRLPDYPDPPEKPRREILLDAKADLEREISYGGTAEELEELQFKLDAAREELGEVFYKWIPPKKSNRRA